MSAMPFDQQLRLERRGANAGLNPMFGEWQHRFEFAPVPYGNGAAQRGEFRAAIQAELSNKWAMIMSEQHALINLIEAANSKSSFLIDNSRTRRFRNT
ncbi:hypothetical protein [Xanthobacter wiegelii]|uniref:hypothetical protein n=1 Tax=Xanthobacter wiegelii TaxID=3119913 RepID=UPI00372AD57E